MHDEQQLLRQAIKDKDIRGIRSQLQKNPNLISFASGHAQTSLIRFAIDQGGGDWTVFLEILKQGGTPRENIKKDPAGYRYALYRAVTKLPHLPADDAVVQLLLEVGVQQDLVNTDPELGLTQSRNTLLHIATQRNLLRAMELLSERRDANMHACNKAGDSPVSIALKKARHLFYGDWTPFLTLARQDHSISNPLQANECIALLKAIIKRNDSKDIPLMETVLAELLSRITDPGETLNQVSSLRQYAIAQKAWACVDVLLRHALEESHAEEAVNKVLENIQTYQVLSANALQTISAHVNSVPEGAVRSAVMEYAKCHVLSCVIATPQLDGETASAVKTFLSQTRSLPVVTTESMQLYTYHLQNHQKPSYDAAHMQSLVEAKRLKVLEILKPYSSFARQTQSAFQKAFEQVKDFFNNQNLYLGMLQVKENKNLNEQQKRALYKFLKNKLLAFVIEGAHRSEDLRGMDFGFLKEHRGMGLGHRGLTTSWKILELSQLNHHKASLALQAEQKRNADEIAALFKAETQGLPKGPSRWLMFSAPKKPDASTVLSSHMSPYQ